MKNTIAAILVCSLVGFARQGYAQIKTFNPIRGMAYGGVGFMFPSPDMKMFGMVNNGVNFRVGYFHSFSKTSNTQQTGVEIRMDYSKFPANVDPQNFQPDYKYDNQGIGNTVPIQLKAHTETKKPDAFQYLIGPSILFKSGKWLVGPALLFGYASVSQEKFYLYDSLIHMTDPSKSQTIRFVYGEHETNNGPVFVPSFKVAYRFSGKLAGFISADYTFGKVLEFTDHELQPAGSMVNGAYSIDQISNGTYRNRERVSRFRALGLSVNLAYTFTRKK